MKLNKQVNKLLTDLLSTAMKLELASIIIEEGFVRGIDENRSVVIIEPHEVDLPFASLTISRVDLLARRLMLSKDGVDIDCTLHEGTKQVISLKIKAGKATVDFRCVNASNVKIPKQVADEFETTIEIEEDIAPNLTQGRTMMGTSHATILYQHNDLFIEICDENNDVFSFQVGSDIVTSEKDYFAYRYNIGKLHTILSNNKHHPIEIGNNRGILKTKVNGFTVYLLPFVE